MNIFILEKDNSGEIDWIQSAKSLDDMRIVKMPLETAQMLSTIANQSGLLTEYKPTHKNHPCTLWAGQSKVNYKNLVTLGLSLCHEYTARFNKIHASQRIIEWCEIMCDYNKIVFSSNVQTNPPLCMPDEFKGNDLVESYRNFYVSKPNMRYIRSNPPQWFLNKRNILFN